MTEDSSPVPDGWTPLFPLPSVVLPPGRVVPLHLFEPRYRRMARDVAATPPERRRVCLAMLAPEGGEDAGAPAIRRVCGVGAVVRQEPLADGRWNWIVVGRTRVRVDEERRDRPYRMARVTELPEAGDAADLADRAAARLAAPVRALADLAPEPFAEVAAALDEGDVSGASWALAGLPSLPAGFQQELLEQPSPGRRALWLAAVLDQSNLLERLRREGAEALTGERPFPPPPGRN